MLIAGITIALKSISSHFTMHIKCCALHTHTHTHIFHGISHTSKIDATHIRIPIVCTCLNRCGRITSSWRFLFKLVQKMNSIDRKTAIGGKIRSKMVAHTNCCDATTARCKEIAYWQMLFLHRTAHGVITKGTKCTHDHHQHHHNQNRNRTPHQPCCPFPLASDSSSNNYENA